MAKTDDASHFDSYRPQTEVKHQIVQKYLSPFCQILLKWHSNILYLDGFAGRGTYTNKDGVEVPGSPLRALEAIATKKELAANVLTLFIEAHDELFPQMKAAVEAFHKAHPEIKFKPMVHEGAFRDVANQFLDDLKGKGITCPPTFLFVDPCGVEGAHFETIKRLMNEAKKCELFMFFNVEGVKRITGLGDAARGALDDLLGSEGRKRELIAAVQKETQPLKKEQAIISYFRDLLESEIGAEYITAFRVEREDRATTSHYLVHATRSGRGYAIMKDIMWGLGHSDERRGGLELLQRSRSQFVSFFRTNWDDMKDTLLNELKSGKKRVGYFTKDWPQRKEDVYCDSAYRMGLLELETEKRIVVLDKHGTPKPATKRVRSGDVTLGPDNQVKLA